MSKLHIFCFPFDQSRRFVKIFIFLNKNFWFQGVILENFLSTFPSRSLRLSMITGEPSAYHKNVSLSVRKSR